MKKLQVIILLIFAGSPGVKAQYDPLYNQYVFNQMLINPAYAGAFDNASITFMSRLQWAGVEGAPFTNSLTAHSSIFDNKGGVGVYFLDDKFGVSHNTEAFATFSYKVDFGRSKLAMGLQGGVVQYKYNYNELNMEFVDDPSFTPTDENFTQPNFGVGLMLYSEYYYVGLSVPRILNIDVNDGVQESTRYQKHFYISGGLVLPMSEVIKLKPSTLIRLVENQVSVDLNVSVLIKELIWAGIIIRNFNTFGVVTELQVSDRLRIGYSFELPSTKLITNQYGTHEIMLGFDFAMFNHQILKRRYF